MQTLKLDVCLTGKGFKVSKLKDYLNSLENFKYTLDLIQEFGEVKRTGLNKGNLSEYGLCWLNNITLEQLVKIGEKFKTFNVDEVNINVKKGAIKTQTCLTINKNLIKIAAKINANIEIVK